MVMIDEKELKDLKYEATWFDIYYDALQKIEKDLFSDYITADPMSGAQFKYLILYEMWSEIKRKRKPWWKRLCESLF